MTANSLQSTNDEILVMDETGQFQVLSNGELKPFNGASYQTIGNEVEATEEKLQPILPMDTGYEEKMIQPPPPALYKQTSSFYFHPEDEEEAAKHKANIPASGPQKKYSLDKIVAKIVENYKLTLTPELNNRLRSLVYSFLRDRRSEADAKGLLERPVTEAGLDFENGLAENLLEFLKEIKGKILTAGGIVVDENQEAPQVAVGNISSVSLPEVKKAMPVELPKDKPVAPIQPEVKIELPTSRPTPIIKTVSDAVSLNQVESRVPYVTEPLVQRQPLPDLPVGAFKPSMPIYTKMARPEKQGASRINDIKKDYKLVGPVEELSILTLETFRRLGATTQERVQKIMSKIDLLSKDSLAKKSLGISAWRTSSLYKMYVSLGHASMEHNLDLAGVIKEYSAQGQEILTMEEFNAITDLNKQLRF
ncbi:MAG: hypothetical protein WCV73_03985 [Patescibacteria group bacterium]|jgi:hypothetical protein